MTIPGSAVFAEGVLDGRVVLVTGGGTGLGKAAAKELALCGASVVIAGRREEVLAAAAEEIGPAVSYVAGDVRDGADAERLVRLPSTATAGSTCSSTTPAGSNSCRRRRSSRRVGARSHG